VIQYESVYFLPQDAMLVRYMLSSCVRLSQAGTVPKWLTQYHASSAVCWSKESSFLVPKILVKFWWVLPQWGHQIQVVLNSIWRFSTNISLYLENRSR